ncbi:MAG TPA: SpoIVB peptidase S55 [Acidobacteriaceae bacterium]|nr:SpoIVB peptidase S55 [Acidobacteriaceae bacterium]
MLAAMLVYPAFSALAQAPAGPPAGPVQTFPLSEVHRGLHGVAYTVFEGTEPEAMDVEILGLLHNAIGPGQDMILARLTGPKPEYTGVVAGMSGSPVYVDGRLLGALAYRIGEFSKEPIAGITPIEQMLQVPENRAPAEDAGNGPASGTTAALLRPGPASFPISGMTAVSAGPAEDSELRPIDTPLVFSGFSPEAVKLFGDRFRALGLSPVAGIGGSQSSGSGQSSSGPPVSAPLVPGSSVSALLIEGDLEMAATCTVTMIDKGRVLACGHPITQFGNISVPMTKAEVLATLASPMDSFKIINTAQTIGAFTEDRQSAISGVLGGQARMIPVAIHVHGDGAERVLHLRVLDNPDLTPAALMVSVYQALTESNGYSAELTYAVHGNVAVEGNPALKLDSFAAPTDEVPSALLAAVTVGQRFAAIYGNSSRVQGIRSVDLDVESLPGRRSIEIESAQAAQPSARAGDTVTIEATLRPYQGEARNLRLPIHLPATLPSGPLRILLSDGETLDRLTDATPGVTGPTDLNSTIHQLNATHADDVLYVSLLLPDPQAVVDGHTLESIPISMANVLDPLRSNREMSLNGESVVPVTSIPVDAMLAGQRVISIDIE